MTAPIKAGRLQPEGMDARGEPSHDRAPRSESRALPSSDLHEQRTGLPSRELLLDRLTQANERARRHPEFRFAVLAIALDQFRMISDSHGHDVADAVLAEVARRIAACVRSHDTVTL